MSSLTYRAGNPGPVRGLYTRLAPGGLSLKFLSHLIIWPYGPFDAAHH
jgi:hypothetical protein